MKAPILHQHAVSHPVLHERAVADRDVLIAARTHNVAAQPTTVGKRWAMFGEECLRGTAQLDAALGAFAVVAWLQGLEGEGGAAIRWQVMGGLALGAVDYVGKPFSAPIVVARVRNHVRLGRAVRLILSQNDQLDQRVDMRRIDLRMRVGIGQPALGRQAVGPRRGGVRRAARPRAD